MIRPLAQIAVALLIVSSPAHALADDKIVAREAFREGMRQYEVGDVKAALAAFKRAYLSYEEPAFLFNIAQCERVLGEKSEALREYKMYLRKLPAAPNRAEVQKIVGDLEAALAAERRKPPQERAEIAPSPAPALAAAPSPRPLAVIVKFEPPATPPRSEKPAYKKWWVWTVVAVVVAGAGVGLGLGFGLKPSNNTTLPNIGPNSSAVHQ